MKSVIIVLVGVLLATVVYALVPELEKEQQCETVHWTESEEAYGYKTHHRDRFVSCKHANGTDGVCRNGTESYRIWGITGKNAALKSKEVCASPKYMVHVNPRPLKGLFGSRLRQTTTQEIDPGDEWACIDKKENGCLVVECVHKNDGAHNGEYTDCNGGKTCQRFEFCETGLRKLFKNSKEKFEQQDATFKARKLGTTEVLG